MKINPLIPASAGRIVGRYLSRMRDDSCVIERPQTGKDRTGAPIPGFTTVSTEPCRVESGGLQPVESIGGVRLAPVITYEVSFDPEVEDLGVEGTWRIRVNGKVLEVIGDLDAESYGFEYTVVTKAVG